MSPLPSHSDVRAAFQAGPNGADLAMRWMDAVIAGSSRSAGSFAPFPNGTPEAVFARRPALPATDPERYGWRFWALRRDGVLVAPFTGREVYCGTFDAECSSCVHPPSPECSCGIHYMLRARDVIGYADGSIRLSIKHKAVQRIRDHE